VNAARRLIHSVCVSLIGLYALTLPSGAAQIGPSKFDHLTTGYELLGAHLNVPCESCHVGAIFKGTPRDCASCHSQGARITATFKGQNHVLSSNRCDSCHTDVAWMPAAHFDHQEVQGSCATCHNGSTAVGKGPTHIASTNECADCHSVFGWNPVISVDHTQVNGTCVSCHNGTIANGKPANHIPTTASCDNCHTTLAWKPANVMHTGNISNCVACHNGTIATGKTATHMFTSDQCGACHSVVVWKPQTTVDHTQVIGTCYSCHNGTIAAGKAANHPANTDNTCENCHATTAWKPANVHHNGITNNCVACHNNAIATGKPSGHIATSNACQACHSVLVWNPQVTVDHTQVLGTCSSCHNGSIAIGRAANHIPAPQDCGVCHLSTVVFGPGTVMNHTGITSNCASCHETGKTWLGVTMVTRPTKAQDPNHPVAGDCSQCHSSTVSFSVDVSGGKPVNHIPTSQACSLCHGDPGDYSIYKMNHAGITNNCTQCHGPGLSFANIVPKEPPATHIPTTTACETCHAATNFTAFGPGTVMNHTGITSNCASCHETGKTWYGVTMVDRPTAAQDASHPKTGDCSQCHSSTTSFSVVTAGKPANHIPTTQACTLCHSNAGNYAIYNMNHAGITNNCALCHGAGLSFANIVPKEQPASHIPVPGMACENCHSPANFGAFGPGTAMSHAGITGNCASCHETGLTWYGVTMVDRPTKAQDANHPATGECSNCHSSTASFSSGITGGNKPSNHIPTNQACTLCHTTAGNYALYVMNHHGITSNCAQCHAAGLAFANITPKEPPATHLPIGGLACENCHSPAKFTAFGPGTVMSHAGISNNCASCHETGKTWYGVTMVDRPTAAQDANHPTTGECSNCHTSTVSFLTGVTGGNKPANHIPTTQACTLCHSNASNYAVYAMNHQGITGNCAQCHAASLTFANITPKEPPANHLPISGLACESCHSVTNFTAFGPGTVMSHNGITGNCASCHETGKSWYGVTMVDRPTAAQDPNHPSTGECSNCHSSTVSFTTGLAKPANHIPTSQACTLCHTNAANYAVYTMNHAGITGNCAQCHAAGLSFANITPKEPPATHLPINGLACENCHAVNKFTAFGPGTAMNHTGITSNCASCHETGKSWYGVTMVDRPTAAQDANHPTTGECSNCHSSTTSFTAGVTAKPSNHIPTLQTCSLCHTTAGNYAVAVMSHSGITNNCAQCHAAGLSFANIVPKEPPATHLPINGLACENCHSPAKFTAFGPGTAMSHTGITGNCASCHETGKTWYGVTMVDRPTAAQDPSHPATGECSNCHSSTTSFSAGVTSKPANHIPTTQACTLCHSNSSNYAIYAMNHSGIVSNCIQCHGAGLSFANIVPKEPPANHIPTSSIACEGCHSLTNFTAFSGTKMNHTPVAAMTCESCHETGDAWFGVQMVDRPKGHHTGQDCKGCHNTTKFDDAAAAAAAARIKAAAAPAGTTTTTAAAPATAQAAAAGAANLRSVTGSNVAALPATPTTPSAPAAPSAFNLAGSMASLAARANGIRTRGSGGTDSAFVHVGTRRDCATCHNGLVAMGKSPSHVPTNDSCANCHTTVAWTPARFEHIGVTVACVTCHDSVHATGRPAHHVVTALACNTCHSTMAWLPVIFRHSGITGTCQSCHNGLGTSGKPVGHMVVALDCASCHHNTLAWSPAAYSHTAANYPGEHRASLTCTQCHSTNTEQIPWASAANAPSCAGCHARNYQAAPHTKYGNVKYTVNELKNCAGACHVYSDATLKSIVKLKAGPQHQVSSGQF
jgi:hypothetical protein